jgi:hypothetical protein
MMSGIKKSSLPDPIHRPQSIGRGVPSLPLRALSSPKHPPPLRSRAVAVAVAVAVVVALLLCISGLGLGSWSWFFGPGP